MLLAFGRKKSPSYSHPIGVGGWLRRPSSVAVNRGRDTTWIPACAGKTAWEVSFQSTFWLWDKNSYVERWNVDED